MAMKKKQSFSGLEIWGNILTREPKRELQGTDGVKVYKEMYNNSGTISAMVNAINTLCLQADLNITPTNDNQDNADFLSDVVDNLHTPMNDILQNVLTMIMFGWSVHEVLYTRRDGRIVISDVSFIDQSTLDGWNYDEHDQLDSFSQVHPTKYTRATIPLNKMLHFTIGDNISPEGRSLLRSSYNAYYYATNLERQEAIAIERSAASMPVLKVPSRIMAADASASDKATLSTLISQANSVKIDEVSTFVLPSDVDENNNPLYDVAPWDVNNDIDIDTPIRRYHNQMLQSILADWIALGSGATGSYSLADSKTTIFTMSIQSILKNIEQTMNKQFVAPLFALNNITTDVPKFKFADIETQDLTGLAQYINQLSMAGFIRPSPELNEHLLNTADLPTDTDSI